MSPKRADFYIASSSTSTPRVNNSLPLTAKTTTYSTAAPAITADVFERSLKAQSSLTVPGGGHSRESSGSKTVRAHSAASLMDTARHERDLVEHLAFKENNHEVLEDLAHNSNDQRAWNRLKENYRVQNPEAIEVLHRLAFEEKNHKALQILTYDLAYEQEDKNAWRELERQRLNNNKSAIRMIQKLADKGDEHALDILLDADKHEYDFDKPKKNKTKKKLNRAGE